MQLVIKLLGLVVCPIVLYFLSARQTDSESEETQQATIQETHSDISLPDAEEDPLDLDLDEDFSIEDLIRSSHD